MRRNLVTGSVLSLCLLTTAANSVSIAGGVKNPIKKPVYDPAAEEIELFTGMESGQLSVKLICKDEFTGNVFIENTTSKPLTVKLPRAAVGVQVLKQGFGLPGVGLPGANSNASQPSQGNGQAQSSGGGFGPGQNQGSALGIPGGGGPIFSVPAERVVQVPFHSVCLNHGQPNPRPALTYRLVPVETYTKDPVLQELLADVGTGKLDRGTAQAAAWHLTDKLTWEQLASKTLDYIGGRRDSYFSRQQISDAITLLKQSESKAQERVNAVAAGTKKKL